MILYHFNFGFPLMSEHTTMTFPSGSAFPRDDGVELAGYDSWGAPQPGYTERVYYHEEFIEDASRKGWATVTITNERFPVGGERKPLSVNVAWATKTLNRLVQWKMPGEGMHVLGIEPANCHVEGRAAEREYGTLVMLQPGEQVTYELELSISQPLS